jgi:glucosamine-6-phosphate deaminase
MAQPAHRARDPEAHEQDYIEHHLSSLLAVHGSAGHVNGLVFNRIGARIRGRSKLPAGQRIICFSPTPTTT